MTDTGDRYPIQIVLDHLSSVGMLDRKGVPSLQKVASLPLRELVDLGVFIAKSGTGIRAKAEVGSRVDCASVGLSGGAHPCVEAECRLNRARELARYAILLSDRVCTYNPFSQFLPAPDGTVEVDESDDLRLEFWIGLRILKEWAPLVAEGLIFPFPHGDHYCHWCLAKASFGADAGPRLDRALRTFKRRFHLEAKTSLSQDKYGCHLEIRGPEDLIAHGRSLLDLKEVPRSLRVPRTLALLARGDSVALPLRVAQGLQLATSYSSNILHTLRYGLVANQLLGTAYATDAPAEVELLAAISGRPDIAERNRIAAKHLSMVIPFLPAIPVRALLRLRAVEGEAFLRYRAALAKAVSALRTDRAGELTEAAARSLFGDVISPELARIEILVSDTKRRALSGAARSLLGWGAALTFGLYSGLLPAELVEAAKLLGATGVVKELVSQLATLKGADTAVRQESYYFLWRARRLRRSRRGR